MPKVGDIKVELRFDDSGLQASLRRARKALGWRFRMRMWWRRFVFLRRLR
jgi:hypothetical protein